jgi:predicted histidine transporter YuiF (NhaC family)
MKIPFLGLIIGYLVNTATYSYLDNKKTEEKATETKNIMTKNNISSIQELKAKIAATNSSTKAKL